MTSIIQEYKNYFLNNYNHFFAVSIFCFYPITFFLGTGVVNFFVLCIDIILIIEIIRKKKFNFFHNITFYSLLLLWVMLLINIFFSIDPLNSLGRSVGFIRFIFFVMAIIYYFNINNQKYQKIILGSWLLIFSITIFDLIFEIIMGHNILGFKSYMYGRLSGFFNDELIAGHYFYAFILIILSFIYKILNNLNLHYKNIHIVNLFYPIIFLFFSVSFLIGERSNFIKISAMIFLFIFLFDKKFFVKKIILLFSMMIIFLSVINFHPDYKDRFITQFKDPIKYIAGSGYKDHFESGLKIFLENKITGVGLKNYRVEVKNNKYTNPSIHPHHIHVEFLSELGLIGYISFIIFFILNFINYYKSPCQNNKHYKLAGLLFIITTFIPFLPSGSFFTSHAATLFWMNFGFMSFREKIN
tara:strand:+ start:281 stop:1519 length:1239 start_codon:yes stop_codon:yes gene_type:complete